MTTDLHSVRSDVWAELRAQTTEKIPRAAERFALIRAELDELERRLKVEFQRYETTRGVLEEGGVIAQMKLSPVLDAAYREWERHNATEPSPRVQLEVTDPPIGPEPTE